MHVSNLERRPCVAGLRPQRELGAPRDNYDMAWAWWPVRRGDSRRRGIDHDRALSQSLSLQSLVSLHCSTTHMVLSRTRHGVSLRQLSP